MIDTLRSILSFIVVLGVLVFFHELGHYLMARARGVVVETFSVGFGPALISRRAKSGTVWKISALPLGGYVKMQGWGEDLEDGEPVQPGSFAAASLGSRALIVAAGPIANLLLAFLLFFFLFLVVGLVTVQPVVSKLTPGAPAAVAGLMAGDKILTIGDQKVKDFRDLQSIVSAHPGASLPISYDRAGQTHQVQVTIGSQMQGGDKIGLLGVEGDQVNVKRLGPIGAVSEAGQQTWELTTATLLGLWNLVAHHQGVQDLGGPLRIAQLSGQVAAMGVASLVSFIAMLSVNLGLVNLIPIPILDGGHLLFYIGEAFYGRPIPRKAQDVALRFGGVLLLCLFVFTTFNDLTQLGAVRWVAHLLG